MQNTHDRTTETVKPLSEGKKQAYQPDEGTLATQDGSEMLDKWALWKTTLLVGGFCLLFWGLVIYLIFKP